MNGTVGCDLNGNASTITTCTGTSELAGTGFDTPTPGMCSADSLSGGATGWLTTQGNVKGGETITLRIAIWDTSDALLDSTAILDNFRWSLDPVMPGTFAQ